MTYSDDAYITRASPVWQLNYFNDHWTMGINYTNAFHLSLLLKCDRMSMSSPYVSITSTMLCSLLCEYRIQSKTFEIFFALTHLSVYI